MKKYKFPLDISKLSVENIKAFLNDFKNANLKAFLKSAPAPEDNSKPLKTIVGTTFENIVLASDDDVFIKFYAPWCGHCKSMAPAWEQLAEELKDVSGLVIADFDATANEAEGVDVQGFPTLKFYPKGAKSSPLDFDGGRDLEGFKNYLKEHSPAYKKYLESKTEL